MRDRSTELKRHIHNLCDAGVRRTRFHELAGASLAQTVGEPRPLRRAKAFAHLLDKVEQAVLPHELVAGSILGLWPLSEQTQSAEERLEQGREAVRGYLRRRASDAPQAVSRWALMGRDHYDGSITFRQLQDLARDLQQEFADRNITYSEVYRVLEHEFTFDYGEPQQLVKDLPWFASNHLHLDYGTALERGLGGIRDEILDRLQEADNPGQRTFYESALIAVEGCIRFIRRYCRTLRGVAEREADAARAAELRQMAKVCEQIAEALPETFRQAVQLMWMLHIIGNLQGGSAMSLGRLDQYLWPFYERDRSAGRIAPAEAQALLECVWLKVNEPKMRTVQSVCLGGTTAQGEDGTNELTDLCLRATHAVAEPYPNTAVRVHAQATEELWDRIADCMLSGNGQPQIFNDAVMLPGLSELGYPAADARDYYPMGCVEVMLAGMMPTYHGGGAVMFPVQLELVFTNGEANLAGETGRRTGELNEFGTFEQFMGAFLLQVRHRAESLMRAAEESYGQDATVRCDPFASLLVKDCLAKGKDVCRGGARYPRSFVLNSMGLGTAADSLAAIKTCVYQRKAVTLHELKAALDANFGGHDALRAMLRNAVPAFGNDQPEVDELAERTYREFVDAVLHHESSIGAIWSPQSFSYHSHVWRGEMTDATPDGRLRSMPFSDGIGPSQGRDVSGPTCLINSVTRLDFGPLTGGTGFNLKLNPGFVRGAEGREILKSLLRTYVERGGLQIQVNLVDQETLKKAQQRPDEYRHVIVRVAGFCEYFVSLDRKLQDEIIQRTAQEVGAA